MTHQHYDRMSPSGALWLGHVPAHWTLRRLGYFFDERREKVSDKEYPPLSVTKNGIVPQLNTAAKTDDGDNRKKVVRGDFVINSRSDRKGSAGIAQLDGSVSLINTVLRPQAEALPRFVHYLLRSSAFQEEFYRYGQGIVADLWTTRYSEMRAILLAMPPLSEQTAIAAFLDRETSKIDALVEEQKRLIELLKEKRQAVISHAVTKGLDPNTHMKPSGMEWLGDVPKHWQILQLRRLLARVEQGWSPECENRQAELGEWGVLKTGCANGSVFREEENKALPTDLEPKPELEVRAGDLLMSRANGSPENVGAAAYVSTVRPGLMLSDKIFRLHPVAGVSPKYLALLLRSLPLRRQIEQAISGADGLANNLPQSALKNFVTVLPPVDEQNAIIEHLEAQLNTLGALADHAAAAVELLVERRSALISAAVTGKIDVRDILAQEVAA